MSPDQPPSPPGVSGPDPGTAPDDRADVPPPRALTSRYLRLSAINILANVTVPLAGLVDTAILGHLDEIRHLAGVALASVLFDYVYWTFGFLRMGTTGTTAQCLGASRASAHRASGEVHRVLYRALFLAIAIAAGLLVSQVAIRELGFRVLAGAAEVEASGRAYFDARIWGAPAALCNFALIGWYLGREESRHVLVMTVVANGANVVLDWLLVVRWGMAARGAGLATMLGQYAALAVGAILLLRTGRLPPWRWREIVDRRMRDLLSLNRDILVRTLCLVSTFAVFTNLGSSLGTTVLAANAILLRILNLASYLIDGAAFATESLAGIFRGAGDRASLRRLVGLSLGCGLACAIVFAAAIAGFPRWLPGLLTSHADVVAMAAGYAGWLVPVLLAGSLAYILDGLFLGLTEGGVLRNSMLLSTLGAFLPLALVAVAADSNHVLWAAMALFMLARAATLGRAAGTILAEAA